jgi:hypothetical protein
MDLIETESGPVLSQAGMDFFQSSFVRDDGPRSLAILQQALIRLPTVATLLQALDGVPTADRSKAEIVLRSQGFGNKLDDRSLGSILMIMDRAELIRYSRRDGRIAVLMHPSHAEIPPPSIIIDPVTPFSNRVWLRRVLEECDDFICWLDKHFLPAGLESIWEAADGNRIDTVRVLSLSLNQNNGVKAVRQYRNLQRELQHKGIQLEWNTIDTALINDTHDRWIIGASSARNVPDVNSILSGRRSELNSSGHPIELKKVFDNYWSKSAEMSHIQGSAIPVALSSLA